MRTLKQSTAYALSVFMVDEADHVTGVEELTLTIAASKAGGAFAAITPDVTELGDGWYVLALTDAHTDTVGDLALDITAVGADPTRVIAQVSAAVLDDLATGADLATVDTVVDGIASVSASLLASSRTPFPMQPFNVVQAITPSDEDDIAGGQLTAAIYVGVAGDVTVVLQDDTTALFTCVSGQTLAVAAKRVNETGTDAEGLLALFTV